MIIFFLNFSFQPDCMYYWTHTQTVGSPRVIQDVNKLPHMWPPNLSDSPDKPGLKYTEAGMRHSIRVYTICCDDTFSAKRISSKF